MTELHAVELTVRPDGVGVVRIELSGLAAGAMRSGFVPLFDRTLHEIEGDAAIVALVVEPVRRADAACDSELLKQLDASQHATEAARLGHRVVERLAKLSRPTVAALHSDCLGAALEIALACRLRIASDERATRFGLPEVRLGLCPSLGATQRLPRLIALEAALELMIQGRAIDARRALELGLVDELVPAAILLEVAAARALELASAKAEEPSLAGRLKSLASRIDRRALSGSSVARRVALHRIRREIRDATRGNCAAPERIFDAVEIGLLGGEQRGLEAEAEAFGELVLRPEATALAALSDDRRTIDADTGVDRAVELEAVRKVGIVGAGTIGAGVAAVTALAALPVRLCDKDDAAISGALRAIVRKLSAHAARPLLEEADTEVAFARIRPTLDGSGFETAEILIEAVYEDLRLKQKILQDLEQRSHPRAVLASTTSSLSLTELQQALRHPERLVGMHYFAPVERASLLEIVTTPLSAPRAVAMAVALGKKQGKTVIVVQDGPGFFSSRVLAPFIAEALELVSEGVTADGVDGALVDWGFHAGPLAVLDQVGFDIAERIAKVLHASFGQRMSVPKAFERLLADGRSGRRNLRGFYVYEDDEREPSDFARSKCPVDPSVYQVLQVVPRSDLAPVEIAQRCVLRLVNEAAHAFGEGVLRSARDGDVAAVLAFGFPAFRGGPFRWVDDLRAIEIVRRLERYQKELGDRFAPAPALVEMARTGATFHGPQALPARPRPRVSRKRSAAVPQSQGML